MSNGENRLTPEQRRKQLQRISGQVEKYVQIHDKIFLGSRNDALVDAGAQKRPRRDGKAPTHNAAHRFWADPDNKDAARKIERVLPDMRSDDKQHGGISLYRALCTAGLGGSWGVDFAEFRRWEDRATDDARKHYRAYEAALNILTIMVVTECERRGENPEIHVNTKGEDGTSDEPVESKDAAAKQDAGATRSDQRAARDNAIRDRYQKLKASMPWSDSQIRRQLRREFAPPGKIALNRETVNSALRDGVAA